MLTISRENHLAVFDSKQTYTVSYLFELTIPEQRTKTDAKNMTDLKN